MSDTEDNVSQWLSGGGGWKKRKVTAKRYPPPIPSKFPWEMKRYYTEDGRLIINVEKATCRLEYFESRRTEGRLRLDLVQYDCEEEEAVKSGEKIDCGEAALADCHGGDGGGNRCFSSVNVGVAVSEMRHVLRT